MKKILVDTNIILDFALQRQDFGEDAKNLLLFLVKNQIKGFISASSITDIYYVLRKAKGHEDSIIFLKNSLNIIKVIGVDEEVIINALNSEIKDFEDAVQCETAKQNDIKIIITRNKTDYKYSGLKIYNPSEYMNLNEK